MRYVKSLCLLAVVAAALMAFAGGASATVTDKDGNKPSFVHASNSGNVLLTASSTTVTCSSSTMGWNITTNGASHAEGPVTTLKFEGCSQTVKVVDNGSLTATDTGTNTAIVYSTGAEVTILTHLFFFGTVHCTLVTNDTDIGTLTGSGHHDNPNTTAKLDVHASVPVSAPTSDELCGEIVTWEGSYLVSSPDHVVID